MTYENEDLMYAIQDAYEDGYKEVKDFLNKTYRYKQFRHQENLKKLSESVKENQINSQALDENHLNQCYLLAFSNLIRFFPSVSFPTDKLFDDLTEARIEGIKAALEAMKKMIKMFDEVAETEEEKSCVTYLIEIYEEIRNKSMGLSFQDWKQENYCGWFLSSREQDEQYKDFMSAYEWQDLTKEYVPVCKEG